MFRVVVRRAAGRIQHGNQLRCRRNRFADVTADERCDLHGLVDGLVMAGVHEREQRGRLSGIESAVPSTSSASMAAWWPVTTAVLEISEDLTDGRRAAGRFRTETSCCLVVVRRRNRGERCDQLGLSMEWSWFVSMTRTARAAR